MLGDAQAVRPCAALGEHKTRVRGAAVDLLDDGGFDNDVTNEPIFGEEAAGAQQPSNLVVTADSGGDSGLDNPENEPISGDSIRMARCVVARRRSNYLRSGVSCTND